MKAETITKLAKLSRNVYEIVRISAKDWESLLLDNHQVELSMGGFRYLQGVKIGDGVFAVKLLPQEWEPEFGTIQIEPRTKWITNGKGLVFSPPDIKF